MTDLVFIADSQATVLALARSAGMLDANGNLMTTGPIAGGGSWQLSPVGPVVLTPAVVNPSTMQVTTPAQMSSWVAGRLRLNGDGAAWLAGFLALVNALVSPAYMDIYEFVPGLNGWANINTPTTLAATPAEPASSATIDAIGRIA